MLSVKEDTPLTGLAENDDGSDDFATSVGLHAAAASTSVAIATSIGSVETQQRRLAAVRRKVESLPAIRLKGAALIRCTGQKAPTVADVPRDADTDPLATLVTDRHAIDVSAPPELAHDTACPSIDVGSGGVTSSAGLLAWIEQLVLASDVALRRFEPVVDDLAQQLGGLHLGGNAKGSAAMVRVARDSDEAVQKGNVTTMDVASMSARYRAADIEIRGSYLGLYSLMERFARTDPPLIVVSSRVRSDGQLMRWEARVVVTDAGRYRLGTVSSHPSSATRQSGGDRSGSAGAPNPFAPSVLPVTGQAARLIGVMRLGQRNVGLFAHGSKRHLLEAGAVLGDARIVGIHLEGGTPRAELAPLTGESLRVLLLRSRK